MATDSSIPTGVLQTIEHPQEQPVRRGLISQIWGSLRGRIFTMALLACTGALLACAIVLTVLYRHETQRLIDAELEKTLDNLTAALLYTDVEGRIVTDSNAFPNDPRFRRILSGWYFGYVIVDADLEISETLPSRSLWDSDLPIEDDWIREVASDPGVVFHYNTEDVRGLPVRVAMSGILLPDRDLPIVIFAAQDRSSVDHATKSIARWLFWSFVGVAALLLGGMVLVLRFVLRPLNQIESALEEIRDGRRKRLTGKYLSEIDPLVDSVNHLLDHNQKVVDRARNNVGNLAHALKNPITVLMNESDDMPGYAQMVQTNAESMWSNVEHYLKRAQTAANAEILGTRTVVGPAAEDLARTIERLNRDKGLAVKLEIDEDVVFKGERQDLDDLLGNLMENAGKWCVSRVCVTGKRINGQIELVVDDDGPGIPPEHRESALNRGQRHDETTPGTGLGLSIVSDTAEMYGGSLSLEDSPLGGLRARLQLPAAAP